MEARAATVVAGPGQVLRAPLRVPLKHKAGGDRHAVDDAVVKYHQRIDDEMARERVTCPACDSARQGPVLERHERWVLHECLDCGVRHFWPAKNPGPSYYQTNEMY